MDGDDLNFARFPDHPVIMRIARGYVIGLAAVLVFGGALALYQYGRSIWSPPYRQLTGHRSVADILDRYGDAAVARITPYFRKAGLNFPPREAVLLAMKKERRLDLWARNDGSFAFVRSYEIQGASGTGGPKLREGDKQVPEGVYRVVGLNPNSAFHLSLKLNYPNDFDRRQAERDGRSNPGSDIFIHGKAASIGCLAMGDRTIEELFVLAARIGGSNTRVVIAPHDPRSRPLRAAGNGLPAWTGGLYTEIAAEFRKYSLIRD